MSFDKSTTAEQAAVQLAEQIKGKNVLITGVNATSLGGEVVRVLASYADKIIILGRSLERAQSALDPKATKAQIHFVSFDIRSLVSVSKASAEINALGIPIHVVICSAILPIPREIVRSEEGFEGQFAGSHLAHFKLVSGIMPSLRAGRSDTFSPRLVCVSSNGHLRATSNAFDDPVMQAGDEGYNRFQAYAVSKLANVLFARDFARRYADQGLEAVSLHPGAIRETGARNVFTDEEWAATGLLNPDGSLTDHGKRDVKTREEGAGTLIVAAFDPAVGKPPGMYLLNNKVIPASSPGELSDLATSNELATKLWNLSERLIGSRFDVDKSTAK